MNSKIKLPSSDSRHELLLIKNRKLDAAISMVVTLIGVSMIIDGLKIFVISEAITIISGCILVIVILVTYFQLAKLSTYDLSTRDEYESMTLLRAKAAGYSFLLPSIIVAIFLGTRVDHLSWPGLLLVIFGLARLIEINNIISSPASESVS